MIIGSEGKQSLEGFLNLTIYVYTLLASPIAPLYTWETFGRWEFANNNRIATYIERHERTCARIFGLTFVVGYFAFKNSSNITPQLLPLAGNSNIDNTCFSCHPWRFFSLFFIKKQNTLQQRSDQKLLHKSFHVSQYKWLSYFYLQALISRKSLKYKVGL